MGEHREEAPFNQKGTDRVKETAVTRRCLRVVCVCALILAAAAPACAQSEEPVGPGAAPTEDAAPNLADPELDVIALIRSAGGIGVTIIVLSIAALSLILEHLVTIRRGALQPRGLAQDLHAHITNSDFTQAEQACKLRPSYLAYIVLAGLQEVKVGYGAVEKAIEDSSQDQAARLFRKVEYLALIGNIAPMLGLLGTVYGLVLAFKRVSENPGAGPAELADGIYLALITTVMGLVVSIPALSAYAIFRARVEQLTGEVTLLAEQIFVNYKRNRTPRRKGERADSRS